MKHNQDAPIRVESPAGGINDGKGASILRPGETPAALNVDFNRDAVESCGGTRKIGNRPARSAGIRTKAPSSLPPLEAAAGLSVPMRGYGFLPYNEQYDIGGDGATDGAAIGSEDFAARRGKSFEIRASFSMPKDQKQFYDRMGINSGMHPDVLPTLVPPVDQRAQAGDELCGYDECLDEITIILQGGGDRMMPMSWAIGVTNLSKRAAYLGFPGDGPGHHALVFMWLDAPGWGENTFDSMNYRLDDGLVSGSSTSCTHALRAIACPLLLEPGREYSFTVGVQLDSGTAGTPASPTTAWEEDGWVQIAVKDDLGNQSFNVFENVGSKATPLYADGGIITHKGPTDSLEYLCKYGLRFTGKLPIFVGLGYRTIPWDKDGFLVYGMDSASLESGGFSMSDISDRTAPAGYVMTARHVSPASDVEIFEQYVTGGGIGPLTQNQLLPTGAVWDGVRGNSEALRGYYGALWKDNSIGLPEQHGFRWRILGYRENGGQYYLESDLDTASYFTPNWGGGVTHKYTIYPFRWNQRDMDIGEVRIYSKPQRMSSSSRSVFSLRGQTIIGDKTEPNVDNLLARWSLADAGGAVLQEDVSGSDGYLAPFGIGQSDSGSRNEGQLFLSGEGEALVLDFEKNPVLQRELQNLQRDDEAGMAIELTVIMPEPSFAYPELLGGGSIAYPPMSGNNYRGKYAPTIARWTTKEEARSGLSTTPKPLLELTHRCIWATTDTGFRAPMGFGLLVGNGSDQEDTLPYVSSTTWNDPVGPTPGPDEGFYWGRHADWVGKRITIQFGLQPLGGGDYVGYVSCAPRSAFVPNAPDAQASEFSLFSLTDAGAQSTGTFQVQFKDLVRSLITIGGAWAPFDMGYSEANCRMIVDEVRVFATTGPGGLPATSGASVDPGEGKLRGDLCLPARALTNSDMLLDLGRGVTTANVADDDPVVTPPSGRHFYTDLPEDTVRAVNKTMLIVAGDDYEAFEDNGLATVQEEFYMVDSVQTNGVSVTTKTPYSGADRNNARVASFRLIGYLDFTADISGFRLSLGTGVGFQAGQLDDEDAILSSELFYNPAPVTGNWTVRTYSPGVNLRDTLPSWVRGVLVPRANAVLGVVGQHDEMYAATRGVIHHVDDRWDHSDGPTDDIEHSLDFRHEVKDAGLVYPLVDDALTVPVADGIFANLNLFPDSGYTYSFDAWVKLDITGEMQTILWYGDQDTDPSQLVGSAAHNMTLWIRVNRGYPEFVIGSTAGYNGGGDRPDRGFYIARAESSVPLGRWTHIRWSVVRTVSTIEIPHCFLNGKKVSRITTNAVANTMTGDDWMAGSAPLSSTALYVAMIGAAHDQHLSPTEDRAFALGVTYGQQLSPNTYHGRLHGLGGKLAAVSASRVSGTDEPINFEPAKIEFTDLHFDVLRLEEERTHRVLETVRGTYGTIESHPFVGIYHELGDNLEPVSFAPYDARVFAANGDRPAVIRDGAARSAGLLRPTTAPTFEVQRFPLWKPNQFNADDPTNAPGFVVGPAGFTANHFATSGNAYLKQEGHSEMRWETDGGTGNWDIFCFKAMFKPRSVSGRIPIYSARTGTESGGVFVEIRDGKLAVGWFDTYLKREVFVETSGRVFHAGYWHFIHIRKSFPRRNGWQTTFSGGSPYDGASNWNNSIFLETAAQCFDLAVVRRFRKEANDPFEDGLWVKPTTTSSISFTVDADLALPAGTTATGMVSATGATFSTAAPDRVNAGSNAFHGDMDGMIFQFGTGAAAAVVGKSYRIVSVVSATQIQVVDEVTGLSPGWAGGEATADPGAVFIGTTLVKSDGFDDSEKPDVTLYDAHYFGSPSVASTLSGLRAFDGEFDFPCVYVVSTANGQGVNAFGAAAGDEIQTGGETFVTSRIYNSGGVGAKVGPLHADGGYVFSSIQTEAYGGSPPEYSQPNEDLEVIVSSESSVHAQPAKWQHIQQLASLIGTRRVRVAFFDPQRGLEPSNPGPQLIVRPAPEEASNPSGVVRLLLSNLPVSQDSGPVERWVYMTTANGQEFFRVARVGDNTSTSVAINKLDASIVNAPVLSFNNPPPPKCSLVAVSQNTLFYGKLKEQLDAVVYSKPFVPASVPASNLIILSGGRNDRITGMLNMRGRMVFFKRDRMWRAKIAQGAAITDEVTSGAGATSPLGLASLDDRVYFVGDRGVFVYTGSGLPVWISPSLERFFSDTVEARSLELSSAAINRARNQFLVTVRTPDADVVDQRVSSEFDHAYSGVSLGTKRPAAHRFSRYRSPNVTVMGEAQEEGGGRSIVLGGTYEGFAVQVDAEGSGAMLGDTEDIWGSVELVAAGGSNTSAIFLSGAPTIDINQSGPRGAELRWEKTDGTVVRATVLYADTYEQALYLDRPIATADIPAIGDLLVLGSPERRWRSKKFDLLQADTNKRWRYLDLMFEPSSASGSLTVDVYADDESSPRVTQVVDPGEPTAQVPLGKIHGHQASFELRSTPGVESAPFELTKFVLRGRGQDQHA